MQSKLPIQILSYYRQLTVNRTDLSNSSISDDIIQKLMQIFHLLDICQYGSTYPRYLVQYDYVNAFQVCGYLVLLGSGQWSYLYIYWVVNINMHNQSYHHNPNITFLYHILAFYSRATFLYHNPSINWLLMSQHCQLFLTLLNVSTYLFRTSLFHVCPFHLFRSADVDAILFIQSGISPNITS